MNVIRFYKAEQTRYVMKHVNGKLVKEGRGLSFSYFPHATSIMEIPLESRE